MRGRVEKQYSCKGQPRAGRADILFCCVVSMCTIHMGPYNGSGLKSSFMHQIFRLRKQLFSRLNFHQETKDRLSMALLDGFDAVFCFRVHFTMFGKEKLFGCVVTFNAVSVYISDLELT